MIRTLPITIRDFDLNKMVMNVARTLYQWQVRTEQRRRLGTLDQRMLDDMGITSGQARTEARKPFFWD
ncbi:MAG: DUF1127 domain-containing protein [Alphaproteobacteria bacterium]|jgi:uncharacterized protein YjiS (DUF1127 family)|nr:DUF1127 domain-containing protein [Alphaproteobacteria bacterium]